MGARARSDGACFEDDHKTKRRMSPFLRQRHHPSPADTFETIASVDCALTTTEISTPFLRRSTSLAAVRCALTTKGICIPRVAPRSSGIDSNEAFSIDERLRQRQQRRSLINRMTNRKKNPSTVDDDT